MNSIKFVSAILAGAAVGAALGILFAPGKGPANRKIFTRKSNDFTNELKDKTNDFIESVVEKFEAAKEEAQQLAENGKMKAEQLKASLHTNLKA